MEEEYFILNPNNNKEFSKDKGGEYYEFEEGPEGAEIFTAEEIKELLNHEENKDVYIGVISIKDLCQD